MPTKAGTEADLKREITIMRRRDRIREIMAVELTDNTNRICRRLNETGEHASWHVVNEDIQAIRRQDWAWLSRVERFVSIREQIDRLQDNKASHKGITAMLRKGADDSGRPLTAHGRSQATSAQAAISGEIRVQEAYLALCARHVAATLKSDPEYRRAAMEEAAPGDGDESRI